MGLELTDSRRLTGPNLLMDRAGAVIDVAIDGYPAEAVVEAWKTAARRLLEAVGWRTEEIVTRCFRGGASLAFSAPIDALYAATEVNEAAWEWAVAGLTDEAMDDEAAVGARLKGLIEEERNPALLRLRETAAGSGRASVGQTRAPAPRPTETCSSSERKCTPCCRAASPIPSGS